ncbi:hypothetical protein [Streptomyces sp. NBC_00470]|uniref:hypothetical protein n=1 Tax=Streptomyces sp. NBC_00470 TaxID=2975753 RepID=UPI002F90F9D2
MANGRPRRRRWDLELKLERLVDPRLDAVLGTLQEHEVEIALLWASSDDMTWKSAALALGHEASTGLSVRRKLQYRGGKESLRRKELALHARRDRARRWGPVLVGRLMRRINL